METLTYCLEALSNMGILGCILLW